VEANLPHHLIPTSTFTILSLQGYPRV